MLSDRQLPAKGETVVNRADGTSSLVLRPQNSSKPMTRCRIVVPPFPGMNKDAHERHSNVLNMRMI